MPRPARPELVCPAGTPASLRTAVDAGADTVYCGLQNATNARNFPGLNFSPDELRKSIDYAHARGSKVLLAVNTFPPAGQFQLWKDAVGIAASVGGGRHHRRGHGGRGLCRSRISAAAAAFVGAGRRVVAGSDPLLLRGIQHQARGAAAHPDGCRDRRHPPPDPLRDRGLRVRQYRNDGGRPLQPDQLCHGNVDQYGRRVFAGGRRPL